MPANIDMSKRVEKVFQRIYSHFQNFITPQAKTIRPKEQHHHVDNRLLYRTQLTESIFGYWLFLEVLSKYASEMAIFALATNWFLWFFLKQ